MGGVESKKKTKKPLLFEIPIEIGTRPRTWEQLELNLDFSDETGKGGAENPSSFVEGTVDQASSDQIEPAASVIQNRAPEDPAASPEQANLLDQIQKLNRELQDLAASEEECYSDKDQLYIKRGGWGELNRIEDERQKITRQINNLRRQLGELQKTQKELAAIREMLARWEREENQG